jgi:hypothetical protein
MKIKNLLLFTLLLSAFSTEIILHAQQPANDTSWLKPVLNTLSISSKSYSEIETGKKLAADREIAVATAANKKQTNANEHRKFTIDMNNQLLKSLLTSRSIYENDSTPEGKKRFAIINRDIDNFCIEFQHAGKNDKEIFDPSIYPAAELTIPSESEIKKDDAPKPDGTFKQAAVFMAAAPLFAADKIANALKINSILAHLAQSKTFNGGLLDTHQKVIGQATALVITAATLGALYKAYQWYYTESTDKVMKEKETWLAAKLSEE